MSNLATTLLPIAVVVVLFVVAANIIKFLKSSQKPSSSEVSYIQTDALFSAAERSFLGVLEQAVAGQFRIMGKVRLPDLIQPPKGLNKSEWQTAFNRIKSKHIDFVACDPNDLSVQFAVELDDRSHDKAKQKDRDQLVNQALASAGLPLFRFSAKRTYSVQEIQSELFQE